MELGDSKAVEVSLSDISVENPTNAFMSGALLGCIICLSLRGKPLCANSVKVRIYDICDILFVIH